MHKNEFKVIGEGSYGCVHMPNLPCKNTTHTGTNYVSKIMKETNAIAERDEFKHFAKYDTNDDFFLGVPKICSPDMRSTAVVKSIKKCKKLKPKRVLENPEDYRLLLLKSGGIDLRKFCRFNLSSFLSTNKETKVKDFWTSISHLFRGLIFFNTHNIIHYDLKPQNILYNPDTNKFVFIDFGLMGNKKDIIAKSGTNNNNIASFHWSYPLDNGLLNRRIYDHFVREMNGDNKKHFMETFVKIFVSKKTKYVKSAGITISNIDAFDSFYNYIDPTLKENTHKEELVERAGFVIKFLKAFDDYDGSYDEFVRIVTNTIDIYSLGFSLRYVLNEFNKIGALPVDFYEKCSHLFETMYDFDFVERESNCQKLLERYEQILLECGFSSSNIISSDFIDTSSLSLSSPSPTKLDILADKDVNELFNYTKTKSKSKTVRSKSKTKSRTKTKKNI